MRSSHFSEVPTPRRGAVEGQDQARLRRRRAAQSSPPAARQVVVWCRRAAPAEWSVRTYPPGVKVPEVRMYTGYGMNGTIVKPPYSTLTAYDLNTGTIKWQVPAGGDDARAIAQGAKNTGYISQRTGIVTTSAGSAVPCGRRRQAARLRLGQRPRPWTGRHACRLARHSGDVRGQRPAVLRRERDLDDCGAGRARAGQQNAQTLARAYVAYALPEKGSPK